MFTETSFSEFFVVKKYYYWHTVQGNNPSNLYITIFEKIYNAIICILKFSDASLYSVHNFQKNYIITSGRNWIHTDW